MLYKWHQSTNAFRTPYIQDIYSHRVCISSGGAWRSQRDQCCMALGSAYPTKQEMSPCPKHSRSNKLHPRWPTVQAVSTMPRNGGWSPERCERGHERLQLGLHPHPSVLTQRTEQASFSLGTIPLWWISIKCHSVFFSTVYSIQQSTDGFANTCSAFQYT